ncbi:MAG: glycosyltransferase [Desulfuromonadaceae bacterium]
MPRILIVPYTNSLGHAGRCLEFRKLLDMWDINTTVVGGGEYDSLFGRGVVPSPQVPYQLLGQWLRTYLPLLPFFDGERRELPRDPALSIADENYRLEGLTERWLDILGEHAPDVVVADARPEIYWAARAMGVSLVGMVSFVWTPMFEIMHNLVPSSHLESSKVDYLKAFNCVGANFGLGPVTDCWQPIMGQGKLIPDAHSFVGRFVDPSYLTIGPQVWSGPLGEEEAVLPEFDGEVPLVYITSGTSWFPVFNQVAEMLSILGYQVIFSGGVRSVTQVRVAKKGTLYKCSGVVSGWDIAQRADLVLCHGGSQTLYQAAKAGTFSLVVPQHFDHQRNGLLFAEHGMAKVLPSDYQAGEIVHEVITHLESEQKMNAPLSGKESGCDRESLLSFFEEVRAL